jgi:hypothetical protein
VGELTRQRHNALSLASVASIRSSVRIGFRWSEVSFSAADAEVGAVSEESLLRYVRGQLRGLEERRRRLVVTPEADTEVTLHRMEKVVVAERAGSRDRLHEFQSYAWTVHHRDSNRAIQFHDRGREPL